MIEIGKAKMHAAERIYMGYLFLFFLLLLFVLLVSSAERLTDFMLFAKDVARDVLHVPFSTCVRNRKCSLCVKTLLFPFFCVCIHKLAVRKSTHTDIAVKKKRGS